MNASRFWLFRSLLTFSTKIIKIGIFSSISCNLSLCLDIICPLNSIVFKTTEGNVIKLNKYDNNRKCIELNKNDRFLCLNSSKDQSFLARVIEHYLKCKCWTKLLVWPDVCVDFENFRDLYITKTFFTRLQEIRNK